MDRSPEVKYLEIDGGSIACQSFGVGPGCLVVFPGILCHIEAAWSRPELSRLFGTLAAFTRVLLVDKRGTGLSAPAQVSVEQITEGRAKDVAAVMDTLGLQRAAILGIADGSLGAMTFASRYAKRVDALVLYAAWAQIRHPVLEGLTEAEIQERNRINFATRWGNDASPLWLEWLIPSLAHDAEWRLWVAHAQRLAATPTQARALNAAVVKADLRELLPSIQARTLVLHACGDQMVPCVNGREVAAGIPRAQFTELQSPDHFLHDNVDEVARLIEQFLTGKAAPHLEQRRVATILFTDVVASTRAAATLGNRRWADVLAQMHEGFRAQVREHGGSVVDTAGDGMLSVFEGPRQAIRCAGSMLQFVRTLNLEARAGVHAGEVEIRGEQVMGLAVHTAARIADLAGSGEVMASRTIKDLLAGSTVDFARRGVHALKGLPDEWELFSVCER